MTVKLHNPPSVALAGSYSLGAELAPGMRTLFVSGQVGTDGKGKVAQGIDKQCDAAWKNVGAVLRSAGMSFKDIVKINTYLTDPRYVEAYRNARNKVLSGPFPASTLVIVSGLVNPAMLVEIEVVAAR